MSQNRHTVVHLNEELINDVSNGVHSSKVYNSSLGLGLNEI